MFLEQIEPPRRRDFTSRILHEQPDAESSSLPRKNQSAIRILRKLIFLPETFEIRAIGSLSNDRGWESDEFESSAEKPSQTRNPKKSRQQLGQNSAIQSNRRRGTTGFVPSVKTSTTARWESERISSIVGGDGKASSGNREELLLLVVVVEAAENLRRFEWTAMRIEDRWWRKGDRVRAIGTAWWS